MKIFDGIHIMCDMDGTLLSSDGSISDGNAAAIERFLKLGGRFAYATGRYPDNLAEYFGRVRPNAPCICYNGGLIYDFDSATPYIRKVLPDSAKEIAVRMADILPDVGVNIQTMNAFNIVGKNAATDKLLEVVPVEPKYFDSVYDITDPWFNIAFWINPAKAGILTEAIKSVEQSKNFRCMRTHDWAQEILPFDVNKGAALDDCVKLAGNIRKTVALGDNENDVELLSKADFSFSPSNAFPCVKGISEMLPVSCNGDFVAAAISRLEKILLAESGKTI